MRLTVTFRVLVCVAFCVVIGCEDATDSKPLSANGKSDQTIRIASDALFPPFHFVEGEDIKTAVRDSGQGIDVSKVTGHDVELLRAVLEDAGFQHKTVVARPYDSLLGGIADGHHDVVAATTGITDARKKLYLFSDPYYETCQAIVVRNGDDEPKTFDDLKGCKVGAAGSGTSAKAVRELPAVETVILEKGSLGLASLYAKKIDAYVVDEFEAVAMARQDPEKLLVLPQPAALESYGFVMAKDRVDLQSKINASLATLKANGRLKEIRETFGVARDENWPVKIGQ